jgi:hypothetical protein
MSLRLPSRSITESVSAEDEAGLHAAAFFLAPLFLRALAFFFSSACGGFGGHLEATAGNETPLQ